MIDTVVKEEPGQIVLSEVFLGLSLLLQNGPQDSLETHCTDNRSNPMLGLWVFYSLFPTAK